MPLWDVSSSPILGEETLLSELLTTFFGWDPAANLLELLAWFAYVAAVGYAFLRPQPVPKSVATKGAPTHIN
jgi:high-affinity Fe2+/Pb2+ permease